MRNRENFGNQEKISRFRGMFRGKCQIMRFRGKSPDSAFCRLAFLKPVKRPEVLVAGPDSIRANRSREKKVPLINYYRIGLRA